MVRARNSWRFLLMSSVKPGWELGGVRKEERVVFEGEDCLRLSLKREDKGELELVEKNNTLLLLLLLPRRRTRAIAELNQDCWDDVFLRRVC